MQAYSNQTNLVDDNEDASESEFHFERNNLNYLTVSQLKSRLQEMNVSFDMQYHPKTYFLDLYWEAINNPLKRRLIINHLKADLKENSKNKDQKFSNNKRKRAEDTKIETKKKPEKNKVEYKEMIKDSVIINPPIKVIISEEKMEAKHTKPEHEEFSNTTKYNNANKSLENLPNVNSTNVHIGINSTDNNRENDKKISGHIKSTFIKITSSGKNDNERNALTPHNTNNITNNENKINNPNTNYLNLFSENLPTANESITTLNRNIPMSTDKFQAHLKNSNQSQEINYSRTNYDRTYDTNMNWSVLENNQQAKEDEKQIQNYNSHYGINSEFNNEIEDRNFSSTEINFKNERCNQNDSIYKGSKSNNNIPILNIKLGNVNTQSNEKTTPINQSNKSQPLVNSNSFFKNEFNLANDIILSSSKKLRTVGTHVIESINFNNSDSGFILEQYVHDKITSNKMLIAVLLANGLMIYVLYKNFEQKLMEANFVDFPFIQPQTAFFILIGAIALLVVIKLITKNKSYIDNENRLIADNSVTQIKAFLNNDQSHTFVMEDAFVEQYCKENSCKVDDFRDNILPFIKELIKYDDTIEETHIVLNGSTKIIWKLKI